MKSGLYALASLDGSPLDRDDCRILGLDFPEGAQALPGFAAIIVDRETNGRAACQAVEGSAHLFFLGHLDETADLAAKLNEPGTACPALLALHALRKWGPDAITHMPGEWSLLRWDTQHRSLLAGVSANLRDPMRFAANGQQLAIAPDLRLLGGLSWVGRSVDPTGLALALAHVRLRQRFGRDQTLLRGVTAVMPGTVRLFSPGKPSQTFTAPAPPMPQRWEGSFDEAVQTLEITLRQIVRDNLARHSKAAVFLSGGLDSSILAWLAAEERKVGQEVFCLTSVAPSGSGLTDERHYAQLVANTLNLPIQYVTPSEGADPYTLSAETFAHDDFPPISPRHYLYEALFGAARAQGADAVLDGCWGETTVTRPESPFSARSWVRRQIGILREEIRHRTGDPQWPAAGFFVQFSPDVLDALPEEIRKKRIPLWNPPLLKYAKEPMGYGLAQKSAGRERTSASGGQLRRLFPYRDHRLQAQMAGFPAGFAVRDGLNRALARALLKGRLPEAIRLRTQPVPFSPDYNLRLQCFARNALERMDSYRCSEAETWLDLDWLSMSLMKMSCNQVDTIAGRFKVQLTAMAAEFFVLWAADHKLP